MRGLPILLAALALAGPAAAESEAFRDWAVVCDNLRTCSAFGFSPEGEEDIAFVRVERSGAAAARPTVRIALSSEGTHSWRLEIDGKPVPGAGAVATKEDADSGFSAVDLPPAAGEALAAALTGGSTLTLREGAKAIPISLSGSSAALRWMDDRQKRAGTVTALVAKGTKPAGAVPAPPLPPLVRAASGTGQGNLPKKPPAGLLKECEEDATQGFEPTVARVAPGVILWSIPCGAGAYNFASAFYLVDEAGKGARPAFRTRGPDGGAILINAEYDPQSQTISAFSKGRGIGDCGSEEEWVWTGKAFELKRSTLMPTCRGAPLWEWPADYVSRAK